MMLKFFACVPIWAPKVKLIFPRCRANLTYSRLGKIWNVLGDDYLESNRVSRVLALKRFNASAKRQISPYRRHPARSDSFRTGIRWPSTIFSWCSPAFRKPACRFCRARKRGLYAEFSARCKTWPRTRGRSFRSRSTSRRWSDARPGCSHRDEERRPSYQASECGFAKMIQTKLELF